MGNCNSKLEICKSKVEKNHLIVFTNTIEAKFEETKAGYTLMKGPTSNRDSRNLEDELGQCWPLLGTFFQVAFFRKDYNSVLEWFVIFLSFLLTVSRWVYQLLDLLLSIVFLSRFRLIRNCSSEYVVIV